MTTPDIPLRSHHRIPQLGFGTYKLAPESTQASVEFAFEQGYRHIDTAQMYGNEREVGAAVRASGIARDELFITTKLNNGNHEPEAARRSFAESLEAMGLDYVDLFLIHWPLSNLYADGYVKTWETMWEFVQDGRCHTIGVSNFQQHHLETLIERTGIVPAVNQIELHPFFQNRELAEFCRENSIVIEAWAPLVRGAVFGNEIVEHIASAHGCTTSQAVLAWHLAKNHVVFPKAANPDHIKENFGCINVNLTFSEVEAIDALDRGEAGRTGYHPDTMERSS